jgi:hypothetical protein
MGLGHWLDPAGKTGTLLEALGMTQIVKRQANSDWRRPESFQAPASAATLQADSCLALSALRDKLFPTADSPLKVLLFPSQIVSIDIDLDLDLNNRPLSNNQFF